MHVAIRGRGEDGATDRCVGAWAGCLVVLFDCGGGAIVGVGGCAMCGWFFGCFMCVIFVSHHSAGPPMHNNP